MAEQIAQDVVKVAQSMGGSLPVDDTARTSKSATAGDGSKTSDSINFNPNTNLTIPSINTDVLQSQVDDPSDINKTLLVNGDALDSLSADEGLTPGAATEGGGSDTDTSKGDGPKDGLRRHTRSNSVKKPPAFKSVSVTKNFLANIASIAPPTRDRASPSAQANSSQLTARPRLVAKSGSGGVTRAGLAKLNGASGPDASKVWNKNKAVPTPPPKQLTDEELKQQYGIHMATRLQADGVGKESKWADIDDDEDDWAPETVEWMDGTKSTLPAAEGPAPLEESKPEAPKPEPSVEPTNPPPQSPTTSKPGASGGTKTILKPGAAALANQAKSPNSLVLKGAPEKPSLVAKPASTPPVKSPWAQLPPIDKVPPVQINPQVMSPPPQQAPSRFSQRDPHGFDALPPASAAKEIAADDFNRSWRDDRGGGSKELFNSQSGRYEPVGDSKRSSGRPAVLQRPSQQGGQGPAEPSAAFQTSRSGPSEGSWGRRRNSSIISGGSGRRPSFGRPSDVPLPSDFQGRRGSISMMSSDTGVGYPQNRSEATSEQGMSPANQNAAPWPRKGSPVMTQVQPISPYGSAASTGVPEPLPTAQAPAVPPQDTAAIQQQLMREKLERARAEKQRRLEEEEKEEAAKKERLRLKMAALGPAPVPKVEKPNEQPTSPTVEQSNKDKLTPVTSPPKPPIPTSEEKVAIYGMMKVHQPQTVKKATQPAESVAPDQNKQKSTAGSMDLPPLRQTPRSLSPAITERRQSAKSQDETQQSKEGERSRPVATSQPAGFDRTSQAWNAAPTEHLNVAWGGNTSGQPGNVWGPPPSTDKALGNGIFDTSYNHAISRPNPQPPSHQSSGPSLIAPPLAVSKSQTSMGEHQSYEQSRLFSAPSDARQANVPQARFDDPSGSLASSTAPSPGPIGPPPRAPPQRQQGAFSTRDWNHLSNTIAQHDADAAERQAEHMQRLANGYPNQQPVMKQTFKQTSATGELGKRKVVSTQQSIISGQQGSLSDHIRTENTGEGYPHAVRLGSEPSQGSSDSMVHGRISSDAPQHTGLGAAAPHPQGKSRYFSRGTVLPSGQNASSVLEDSPPPPETFGHPAYNGSVEQPKVNIPVPKAVVKLPPKPPSPQPAVTMPVRPAQPRLGSQPIVSQSAWQDRFNGLFGRKLESQGPPLQFTTSPPTKTQSLAVTSLSKAPLDVPGPKASATVSLPSQNVPDSSNQRSAFVIDNSSDILSKSTADQLFDDRAFGSLPEVRLPKKPFANANLEPVPPPVSRPYSKFFRQSDATSKDETVFPLSDCEQKPHGYVIRVRLQGMRTTRTAVLPRKQQQGRRASGFGQHQHHAHSPNPQGHQQHGSHAAAAGKKRSFTPRDREASTGGSGQQHVTPGGPKGRRPSGMHQQGSAPSPTHNAREGNAGKASPSHPAGGPSSRPSPQSASSPRTPSGFTSQRGGGHAWGKRAPSGVATSI